jgi:hypothetical protein
VWTLQWTSTVPSGNPFYNPSDALQPHLARTTLDSRLHNNALDGRLKQTLRPLQVGWGSNRRPVLSLPLKTSSLQRKCVNTTPHKQQLVKIVEKEWHQASMRSLDPLLQ